MITLREEFRVQLRDGFGKNIYKYLIIKILFIIFVQLIDVLIF